MTRQRSAALAALILAAGLLATVPTTSADWECQDTLVSSSCSYDDQGEDSGCESEEGFEGCWSHDYRRSYRYAGVFTPAGSASASSGSEVHRSSQSYQGDIGECTHVEGSFRSRDRSAHASPSASTIGLGAGGWSGATFRHTEGTFIYEDPCGEDLAEGFIEPGSYRIVERAGWAQGGAAAASLVGSAGQAGTVYVMLLRADEATDPSKDICRTEVYAEEQPIGSSIVPGHSHVQTIEGVC